MKTIRKKEEASRTPNRQRGDPEGDDSTPPLSPGEARPKAKVKRKTVWHDLGMLGVKIGAIVLIAVMLFSLVYGLHYNREPDMLPAVKDGDLVIYYRWDRDYVARDLIVLEHQGQTQVRRVVAVAGDTVDISEQGLMINGSLQQEREIFFLTQRYEDGPKFPLTLGEGEVFVLGDYREGATDSRIYGPVNVEDTKGQVITVLRRRNL
ncbi:MAG: signal peptidase I [Coriobacteriia bacterium]|nr:signal peptidase I [Coriobacteriia bacterium]MCL2750125.1 signal peptidase I [Coriobacteriia bacterium]